MAKKVKKKAAAAKTEQLSAKQVLENANKALTTFLKANKLARDEDHSKNKKFGTEFKALTLEVEKAQAAMDEGNAKVSKTKPEAKAKGAAKETKAKADKAAGAGRATIYDYPDGLTPAEKKEFRVKARKAAKGGDKPVKAKTKDAKVSKKEEAPKAKTKGGKKEVAKVETKDIKKKKKKVKKND